MAQKKPTKLQEQKISSGVEKMVHGYEKTGKIKTTRATYTPDSRKKAIKQALAIEYAREHIGRKENSSRAQPIRQAQDGRSGPGDPK